MTEQTTIEIVIFRLKAGTDEAAFLRAAEAFMPDLIAMSGYISRHLFRAETGQWIDTVYWTSREEALRAADAFHILPSAESFGAMIDPSTMTMLHGQTMLSSKPAP